ncbi:hypothetical protein HYALB_00009450 [Hymenoscyphus albidus]|uniref:Uncharacterized protein n=1 Tax=Hymenoscyphus albidus TaxID=595503 RepID=A0A9N9LNW7_9HELO|nr:hypothetical protein HYALB_00009450 [Hymenoscyphus albidus]
MVLRLAEPSLNGLVKPPKLIVSDKVEQDSARVVPLTTEMFKKMEGPGWRSREGVGWWEYGAATRTMFELSISHSSQRQSVQRRVSLAPAMASQTQQLLSVTVRPSRASITTVVNNQINSTRQRAEYRVLRDDPLFFGPDQPNQKNERAMTQKTKARSVPLVAVFDAKMPPTTALVVENCGQCYLRPCCRSRHGALLGLSKPVAER